MKKLIRVSLLLSILLISMKAVTQVGIGTASPDTSAVLELNSMDRGFLLPRLTSLERDNIYKPAEALIIYNTTSQELQINYGSTLVPLWSGINGSSSSNLISVTDGGDLSTSSTTYEMIPGMVITPPAGTYLVLFNAQYGLLESAPVNTAQGVTDLNAAYQDLMDIPATNTSHAAVFGNGEVLSPGVYDLAGAASVAGTLFLDGGGDTTSIFIIRTGGALNTGAATMVELTNGARARNVFWVAEGAIGLGADTVMKGTLLANNQAVSAAAGTILEGRMFSTTGAISFGPGEARIPLGNSFIDLGILSTFIMFTSSGAVSNTEPSNITGDVGSNSGAITGFENLDGNIYSPGIAPSPTNNTLVTFSVYQNGVLLATSSRTTDINTSVISLQSVATVESGQSLDIRWHVDVGGVVIGNRTLALIKAN